MLHAVNCFENGFEVKADTDVSFVKLTPLVGG